MNEGLLSVKDASGRQVSLLNSNNEEKNTTDHWQQDTQTSKRKYHCIEPGCDKSFTTSGHLARHNRIHTGEKNFPCLFPGCQSKFSRQDNMMQHYRTHMSSKSRRSQKRGPVEDIRPKPKLHAHHRIRSDPVGVVPPLTIDQHLSNYHESLRNTPNDTPERHTPVRFNFPSPLTFIATSKKLPHQKVIQTPSTSSSPTLSTSSILSIPFSSIQSSTPQPIQSSTPQPIQSSVYNSIQPPTQTDNQNLPEIDLFYKHQPLTFTENSKCTFPFTLLHPDKIPKNPEINKNKLPERNNKEKDSKDNNDNDQNSNPSDSKPSTPSSNGLLQLAHIVSTFG